MNPKLRDLQIQAFAECKKFEDGQFRTDEVFQRFAELIVKECVPFVGDPTSVAVKEMMRHFGVLE